MKAKQKQNGFARLVSASLILSALLSLSRLIKRSFRESFFGHLLSGDHRAVGGGVFTFLGNKINFRRRVSIPVKRYFARQFEQSLLLGKLKKWLSALPDLPLRSVGVFYFSAGLTLSVAYLIRRFALGIETTALSELVGGIASAVTGSILTASKKSCGESVLESRLLSFFLFRALGLPKDAPAPRSAALGRGDTSFLFGIAAGCVGTLTSPVAVLFAGPFLCLAYAVLLHPECGVILMLTALPFLGTAELTQLTLFVTGCWLLKVLRGKRSVSGASLDIAVLAFAAVILLGGLLSVIPSESVNAALVLLTLMMGYFLTVNLIRTTEWVGRCVGALLFSAGATALVGTAGALLGLFPETAPLASVSSALTEGTASLYLSSDGLAALLLLALPFAFTARSLAPAGDRRFGYGLLILLFLVSLTLTGSQSGIPAAIVSLLLFFLIAWRGRAIAAVFCGLLLLPLLSLFLPQEVTSRFLAFFTLPDGSAVHGLDRLLSDCYAGGIGVGETVFRRIHSLYSAFPAEIASQSLFVRITLSVGVAGLAVFLVLLFIFLRHYAAHTARGRSDPPRLRLTVSAGFAAIVGFLLMGASDYVWYHDRVFLLFWMVLGLTSAAIRTAARERIARPLDGPHLDLELKHSAALFSGRKDR